MLAYCLLAAALVGGVSTLSGCVVAAPGYYYRPRAWVPGYWGPTHVWVGGYWRYR